MAETESQGPTGRPRPWLLVALGVVTVLYLAMLTMPGKSAAPPAQPSKPRTAAGAARTGTADPAELDVRLEELKQPRPDAEGAGRNPFRFYVKPAPPPAPVAQRPPLVAPPGPVGPPVPQGPPMIPLKYFGFMDTPTGKIASLSDCRATMRGREGDIIDGRYRLVRIGVESVVMEYLDGSGRTTIRMTGQDCVSK